VPLRLTDEARERLRWGYTILLRPVPVLSWLDRVGRTVSSIRMVVAIPKGWGNLMKRNWLLKGR
jgi:hypothetical protein